MTFPLFFRTDASVAIGTGHVLRCLALAQAWRRRGGTSLFLSHDLPKALEERLIREKMRLIPIQSTPGTAQDLEETTRHLREGGATHVIVDGYHFHRDFHRGLRALPVSLTLIDDTAEQTFYDADFLINQNIDATPSLYDGKTHARMLLLGPQYALLRDEFLSMTPKVYGEDQPARNILLLLGGTDPGNCTLTLLQSLEDLPKTVRFHVIVGAHNPHRKILEDWSSHSKLSMTLHVSPQNLPQLMQEADLAISAAGTTTWELLYLGIPTLFGSVASNQRANAAELERRGLSIDLGDLSASKCNTKKSAILAAQISRALENAALRKKFSKKGRALVDGQGRERVILSLYENQNISRRAS